MKSASAQLKARIALGTAKLCRIWTITRVDSTVYRFTDHDRDLTVGGNVYRATTSFTLSSVSSTSSRGAGSCDIDTVFGADNATEITFNDVISGLYNDCQISIQVVDWEFPQYGTFTLLNGSVEAPEGQGILGCTFPVAGKGKIAVQGIGEAYQPECLTYIYSPLCTLDPASFSATGTVVSVTNRRKFVATVSDSPPDHRYGLGSLVWSTGANAGSVVEVLGQVGSGGDEAILLALNPPYAIEAGDTFTIRRGCALTPAACKGFGNFANYRGFPDLPGPDFIEDKPEAL